MKHVGIFLCLLCFFVLVPGLGWGQNAATQGELTVTVHIARGGTGSFSLFLAGSGNAVIDWGDGSSPDTIALPARNPAQTAYGGGGEFNRVYAAGGTKTVRIRGNVTVFCTKGTKEITAIDTSAMPSLKILSCGSEAITSLDLSKNPELESFVCLSNQITSIKLGNNKKLEYFDCAFNNMEKDAVEALFSSLPDRTGKEQALFVALGNPGYLDADTTLFSAKNWAKRSLH
jgi:hypothetical protein